MTRRPLRSTGSPGESSPVSALLWAAPNPERPSRLATVAPRSAVPRVHSLFAPTAAECCRHGPGLFTGLPSPDFPEETPGPPRFPGDLRVRALLSGPAGPPRQVQLQRFGIAFHHSQRCRPLRDMQLSGLNHTAHTLAVYASQPGSPPDHARLASGWWTNLVRAGLATRRVPQKVSANSDHARSSLPPSPSFAWRKGTSV